MAKDRVIKIILKCTSCNRHNYTTFVKRVAEEKLELNKFCPAEKGPRLHKQTKISSAR